jgi:hypothetical protein
VRHIVGQDHTAVTREDRRGVEVEAAVAEADEHAVDVGRTDDPGPRRGMDDGTVDRIRPGQRFPVGDDGHHVPRLLQVRQEPGGVIGDP